MVRFKNRCAALRSAVSRGADAFATVARRSYLLLELAWRDGRVDDALGAPRLRSRLVPCAAPHALRSVARRADVSFTRLPQARRSCWRPSATACSSTSATLRSALRSRRCKARLRSARAPLALRCFRQLIAITAPQSSTSTRARVCWCCAAGAASTRRCGRRSRCSRSCADAPPCSACCASPVRRSRTGKPRITLALLCVVAATGVDASAPRRHAAGVPARGAGAQRGGAAAPGAAPRRCRCGAGAGGGGSSAERHGAVMVGEGWRRCTLPRWRG